MRTKKKDLEAKLQVLAEIIDQQAAEIITLKAQVKAANASIGRIGVERDDAFHQLDLIQQGVKRLTEELQSFLVSSTKIPWLSKKPKSNIIYSPPSEKNIFGMSAVYYD